MHIETPEYLKLVNDLPQLNLIDATLRLRVFYGTHKFDKLKELFPTESNGELSLAETRVDKLIQDTIEGLQEYYCERDQMSDRFCNETKKKFPEFSKPVVSLYLAWSGNKYCADSENHRREFTDRLISTEAYDAEAVFLYRRANLRKSEVQSSDTRIFPRTTLEDLFPPSTNIDSEHAKILIKVEELYQYCLSTAAERKARTDSSYNEKCNAVKDANPGFSDESYSAALNHAWHTLR